MSLQRIVRITVGTGSLTGKRCTYHSPPTQLLIQRIYVLYIAAVATVCCILNFLPSKPAYYQTSTAILGKLYSNSMLVLLNSRLSLSSSAFHSADNGQVVELDTVRVGLSNLEFLDLETRNGTGTETETAVPDSGSGSGGRSACGTSSFMQEP